MFNEETAERVGNEPPVNTALTAFFQLRQSDTLARKVLYDDVPSYYTWNATSRIFQRKQETSVDCHEGIFKSDTLE
ncbi:hypothetical protein J437_LFUL012326 [Ladona fulva]|uniref:Uncharacterized protein n=1 Tax=Ladona fulva TaxID=123851 RepID=A0A8K0P426_LADFU|nr:hypothetical protein J437_LFUL012326 [Ladona fulva]